MFTVSLDFGSGWEDISDRLAGRRPVERTRAIHADGDPSKPVVSTARFRVARDPTLSNRFIAASASVAVKIAKDSADYFTGTVRDNHKVRVGLMSVEYFEVECVDAWMRLEKKCPLGETWADYAISDPTAKASSILHQLFYAAGFADAELDLAAIAVARDRAVFDASKGRTYRDIIEGILRETGYSAYVDASGIVHLYDLGPAPIVPVATLASGAGGNIAGGYEVERKEAKDEAVDVTFWPHKTLADQVVFEDTTNGSGGILACNIVLASGDYYPEGADADHDVRAEFKVKDYELVAVDSPVLDVVKTSGIDLQVGGPSSVDGLAMRLRLHASAPGSITKLRITGQAIVKGDATTKIRENVASSDKREEISCDWITTDAAADRLGIIRADWHRYSAFDYIFPECTLLTLSPGDYVTFADALLLGATQTLRVVTVSDGASEKSIKLTCEGCSAYAYAVLPYTVTSGNPPPASPAPPGTATIADITDLQTQLGIAAGDTPAPPAPPVLSGSAYGRALVLEWTRPASSDIRLAYDMQISRDAAAWYGLGTVDGWHGSLDDISDVGTVASRVFPSLALAEESGEPVATSYSFRVRARSGSSPSAWSNVIALTIGPWSAGDIAEGAIERAKLEAGFLTEAEMAIDAVYPDGIDQPTQFATLDDTIQGVREGDLVDGAIARAKLESSLLEEYESTISEVWPTGVGQPSLPAITRLEAFDLSSILDIINQETVSRDDAYIIADQKIMLIAEDTAGAVSRVSTLLVTVGEIEASVAEYEGDRTRIGEIEVKADSVTATVADYDGEKAKIAQLQIDLDAITTIVGELPALGEVGNISIITQSATKIDQVISEFGSVVDGTFVPLGAYSDVVQMVDRFEVFLQGTGDDAAQATWIVRPEDISSFMIADDVDAVVDAALDPRLADYVTLSAFEETAAGFNLTVGSYKSEADRASIRDREDFLAWLDEAELVRGSQFVMTDTMIGLAVADYSQKNVAAMAAIVVEADRITNEVSRASAAEGTLSTQIIQTAEAINLAVWGQDTTPDTPGDSLSAQIAIAADQIEASVSGGGAEAYLSLSITLPTMIKAALRAVMVAASSEAVVAAVYEPAGTDTAGLAMYGIKAAAPKAQVKALKTALRASGILGSEIALDADEILMGGLVKAKHIDVDNMDFAVGTNSVSLQSTTFDGTPQNPNGTTGWRIEAGGFAVFDAGNIRGQLVAGQIDTYLLEVEHVVVQESGTSGAFEALLDADNGLLVNWTPTGGEKKTLLSADPQTGQILLTGDVHIATGTDAAGLGAQIAAHSGMIALQVAGAQSEAFMALSLSAPAIMTSDRFDVVRAAVAARAADPSRPGTIHAAAGNPAALDAVYCPPVTDGNGTNYYLGKKVSGDSDATYKAKIKACQNELVAAGIVGSQIALSADEIILDGTVYGRHMNLDSAFIASLEGLSVDAKFLTAGSIDAGQIDATGLAIGLDQVDGLETALERLDDISSDSKLTPVEKKAVRKEWESITGEYTGNIDQGTAFGVSSTNYSNALQAVHNYLNAGVPFNSGVPEWIKDANLSVTTDIAGATFRGLWTSFYSARSAFLNAVAAKAKSVADGAAAAAQGAIALQLGYESYADMVAKVTANGHTYVNGGFINTELIKVGENTLIADGFISTSCLKAASIDIGKLSNLTPANIGAVTPDTVPRYLGSVRYGLAWSLTANAGDWILVLATAENHDYRGIFYYKTSGAKDEYSPRQYVDTGVYPSFLTSSVLSDLLAWTTPAVKADIDYGLPSDYGTSFIANLVASSAFIADLTASEAFIADLSVKHVAVDGDIEAHAMNATAIASKSTTSSIAFAVMYPCTAKLYLSDYLDRATANLSLYGSIVAYVSEAQSVGVMLNPGTYVLSRSTSGTAHLDFHGMFGASDASKLFGT